MRPLTELILAIQFLTRLPTPQVKDFQDEYLVASARWFPLVGLIIGTLLALVGWSAAYLDSWLAAWAMLALWVVVTGGLHLDGLGDVADALGAAHRDKDRLLAVMKDPHLGSFGVLTLIVAVSGKLVLLMLVAKQSHWLAVALIPAWARWGIYDWQTLPALSQGMAERFTWHIATQARMIWLIGLASVSLVYAPVLLLTPLLVWLYRRWLQHALGGVSGDCLGAGVELLELGLLLVVVLASS